MSSSTIVEIENYIAKHRNLLDISLLYYEFKSAWLNEFSDIENVKIEWECVYNERIYGDRDESTEMVIRDFLNALEKLLKK
jgi:hypothetical protein